MVNVWENKNGKVLIEFDNTTRVEINLNETKELFRNLEDLLYL